MKSFNILLTCLSNKIQILEWIRLSLGKLNFKIKIYAADSNPEVLSKYFCDYLFKDLNNIVDRLVLNLLEIDLSNNFIITKFIKI
jgi:hypothetical protein|tara:strand:+ start:170 stop:424 length:255 start_codon:yes stop_codon:yes gene_type:complete